MNVALEQEQQVALQKLLEAEQRGSAIYEDREKMIQDLQRERSLWHTEITEVREASARQLEEQQAAMHAALHEQDATLRQLTQLRIESPQGSSCTERSLQ